MRTPLLSICLRTYNNQEFIREALDGIFIQNVNFDMELIYSDDHSRDQSYEIVDDALKDCSKFINVHLVKQPKNLGVTGSLLYVLNKSQGKYIALCDGDDYWNDPDKLQCQVDFLESNPDYEVCFTNVSTIDEKGNVRKKQLIPDGRRTDYEMQHLPTWSPVSARVFRNRDFNSISRTVPGEDTYMLLYQSKYGKIRFLNIIAGAYRYQSGSIYSSLAVSKKKDAVLKTHMECMELVPQTLYPKYQKLILKKIVELRYLDKALYLERRKDLKSFMKEYPERFSTWKTFKITCLVGILHILDLAGVHNGKSLLLKVINRIF